MAEEKSYNDIESHGRRSPGPPRYQLWPILKEFKSSSGMRTPEVGLEQEWNSSQPSFGPREHKTPFAAPAMPKKQESATIRRRQNSGVETVVPMTTVQEYYMDSPTIPGRFPQSPFQDVLLQPIQAPAVMSVDHDRPAMEPVWRKGAIRDLATSRIDACATVPSKVHSHTSNQQDDRPPAVPPKPPRTTVSTPRWTPAQSFKFKLPSILVPASVSCYQSSGLTPISAPPASRLPNHITSRYQSGGLPRPTIWSHKGSSARTRGHKRNGSEPVATTGVKAVTDRDVKGRNACLKEISETPNIDCSQSTKRNKFFEEMQLKANPSADSGSSFDVLPSGPTPSHAWSALSTTEIERLQDQARTQAHTFQILKYKEVKALSRELKALDERCEYLRNTHRYLRARRHTLHARLIGVLRSPNLVTFNRETMLKQEEALAELDLSIDEWVTKLEYAENRRIRVRQKLLEHLSAVLMLQTMTAEHHGREETPPPSPSPRKDSSESAETFESIRIYADSKVCADSRVYGLMEDIEKEMDLMKSRPGTS